ncbi:hypothetical protein HT031_000245 [Scenedesmus sp. PABB004]|nr:hypothetical protein HT031_000245 [Scenedesmus sp. PABB004]
MECAVLAERPAPQQLEQQQQVQQQQAQQPGPQPAGNAFEAERERTIARNRAVLAELGVLAAAGELHTAAGVARGGGGGGGARAAPGKKKRAPPADEPPARTSRRIRGLTVDGAAAPPAAPVAAAPPRPPPSRAPDDARAPRFELTATAYAAPFTLGSIGTTVISLGALHRGPWPHLWWSSRGCLFRHAYPLGFRASKVAFGRVWQMAITADEAGGPVFTVWDEARGLSFSGPTPTRPWTDVCLHQRTGQRISGPQYFGFSDLHLQRAIAALYTPAELAYAQWGTPLPWAASDGGGGVARAPLLPLAAPAAAAAAGAEQQPAAPLSAEEAFARELRGLSGIGQATSRVLALTTALGGARHGSLAGLRCWLAADAAHVEQLRAFLLRSPEMPVGSRNLPAWEAKWVPLILAHLTTGPGAAAGDGGGGGAADGPDAARAAAC